MGKPAPSFWWDFRGDKVIVQSDYPGGQCLAEFTLETDGYNKLFELNPAIVKAEALIDDYRAGRKTPNWNKHDPS